MKRNSLKISTNVQIWCDKKTEIFEHELSRKIQKTNIKSHFLEVENIYKYMYV